MKNQNTILDLYDSTNNTRGRYIVKIILQKSVQYKSVKVRDERANIFFIPKRE